MRLQFTVEMEDLLAYQLHHYAHSPYLRGMRRKQIVALILLTLVVSGMLATLIQNWIPLAAGVFITVVFALVMPSAYRRANKKIVTGMYGEGDLRKVLGLRELEISEEGLSDRNGFHDNKTYWRGIERIETGEKHTFIYLSPLSALLIPADHIREGNYDAFVHEVTERWKQAKADGASGAPALDSTKIWLD